MAIRTSRSTECTTYERLNNGPFTLRPHTRRYARIRFENSDSVHTTRGRWKVVIAVNEIDYNEHARAHIRTYCERPLFCAIRLSLRADTVSQTYHKNSYPLLRTLNEGNGLCTYVQVKISTSMHIAQVNVH